jgi:hypothetical protein
MVVDVGVPAVAAVLLLYLLLLAYFLFMASLVQLTTLLLRLACYSKRSL